MQKTVHILDVLGNECLELISSDMWFNVAASIYCFITGEIDDEAQFVATYLMSGSEETDNPNLSMYAQFEESLYQIISGRDDFCYPTDETLSIVKRELEFATLNSYLDNRKCACGLLFQLIKAIDRTIKDTASPSSVRTSLGPLNETEIESVGLYLRSANHFIDDFFCDCSISSGLDYGSLNEQLTAIMFFRKENGYALPQIIPSRSSRALVETTRSIKVAVAPIRGDEIPFADELHGYSDICFEYKSGSAFGCRYSNEYALRFDRHLTTIIDKTVNAGCVILILPEFIVTDEVTEMLRQILSDADNLGALQLVVAGSWWNPMERNNVGTLVLAKGKRVHYFDKYAPYIKFGPKGNYTEILERSEKRTVLVDVPGIGLVLPQICRDFAESEKRAEKLAKEFHPAMVLVPSWSNSIHKAFESSLSGMSQRHDAVCVIANACGARRKSIEEHDEDPVISFCASPAIEIRDEYIRKLPHTDPCNMKAECLDSCPFCCSNVWILDVTCKDSIGIEGGNMPEIAIASKLLHDKT